MNYVQKQIQNITYSLYLFVAAQPQDCYDILNTHNLAASGSYIIYPVSSKEVEVWCDMETEGGGWTVNKIYK